MRREKKKGGRKKPKEGRKTRGALHTIPESHEEASRWDCCIVDTWPSLSGGEEGKTTTEKREERNRGRSIGKPVQVLPIRMVADDVPAPFWATEEKEGGVWKRGEQTSLCRVDHPNPLSMGREEARE